jgi:hypothetical protein
MRGMNYKSAVTGRPSAQDTGCSSNNIIVNRRFVRDDNVIERPYNMMNIGIGSRGPVCDRMVAGQSSGLLMGSGNSGGPRIE